MDLRKMLKRSCDAFILSLVLLAALVPSTGIRAISGDGLIAHPTNSDPNNSLTKSWFIYGLDRGEEKEDSLTIKNESDKPQSLTLYAVDSTSNNLGEFALEGETDSKDSVGKWVHLETDHIVLAAGEEKEVKFKISIPEDALGGENAGGIILQKDLTEEQKNTKSGFVINTRIGIRIYETVPGETVRKATFSKASVRYDESERVYKLTIPVKNESSSSLQPTVRVYLTDKLLGQQNKAYEKTINIPRGEEALFTFNLDQARIGEFEVSAQMEYKKADGSIENVENTDRITFWAFPWQYLPAIGALLVLNLLFIIIIKLKKRSNKKYRKTYYIKNGDNLENLAERLETSWKKIAKLNKLKPPYQLEIGEAITVIDKNNVLDDHILPKKEGATKIEVLSAPDESVIQDRKEAFEKDMDLIADDKEEEKPSLISKIAKILFISLILAAIVYGTYIKTKPSDNDTDFVYDNQNATLEQEKAAPQAEVTEEKKEEAPAQTVPVTPAETTIETVEAVDRQAVKVEILNGNGTKGVSSQAAALFKEKGYTDVTTGNAARFDYASTIIECSSDIKSAMCDEAEDILSASYSSIEKRQSESQVKGKITITLGK